GQVEEYQSKRENLPLAVFAHQAHVYLNGVGPGRIRRIAQLHGEKRYVVMSVGAANLKLRRPRGRFTAHGRAARWVCGNGGFAWLVEQHEAFHERDARGRRHVRKRFLVSRGQETLEVALAFGASRCQEIAKGGDWPVRRGGLRCGIRTGFLR